MVEYDRFRLLNSEIGNDRVKGDTMFNLNTGFRLLNSEIGNDQKVYLDKKLMKY